MPTLRIIKDDGTVIESLLDEEDCLDALRLRWHMSGAKGNEGKYLARQEKGRTIYLHRWVAVRAGIITDLIDGGTVGSWTVSVDHANGNKLDNRRGNLRLRNRKQQMLNPNDGLQRNNTSGYRGVVRSRSQSRPWMAQVMVDGRLRTLGNYATFEEAVVVRAEYDRTGVIPQPWTRLSGNNTSGVRGICEDRGRWKVRVNGKHVGRFSTFNEATAAREAYLANH